MVGLEQRYILSNRSRQLHLRVSDVLHQKLRVVAAVQETSVQSLVVAILERDLNSIAIRELIEFNNPCAGKTVEDQ